MKCLTCHFGLRPLVTKRGSDQLRVYLEIHDPFRFDLRVMRKVLDLSDHDPLIKATEVTEERNTGKFVFSGGSWPEDMQGDTGRAVEFRDQWKRVEFLHASEWLRRRPPSLPERLRQQEVESYLVVEGYHGIIPQELLKEVVRLGLEFEVIGPIGPQGAH